MFTRMESCYSGVRVLTLAGLQRALSTEFFIWTHSLTQSSSFLMEDRSSTSARHLTLFWTVRFISCHLSCLSSNSAILVHLQGSTLSASWLCVRLVSSACGQSNHKLRLCLISYPTGRYSACLQSSQLRVCLYMPPNSQEFPQPLVDEHLQFLSESSCQPPSFRTMETQHSLLTQRLWTWSKLSAQ